jgi:hypothetical protein
MGADQEAIIASKGMNNQVCEKGYRNPAENFRREINCFSRCPIVSGRFAAEDATYLLRALTRVKTNYHEQKIKTVHHEEEDIKHSETRILKLEQSLRDALALIKENGAEGVDVIASISIQPQGVSGKG